MLDEKDYKEIAHLFKVIIENDVDPKLKALAEGQQLLLETLAPKNRVEAVHNLGRKHSV